jgi:ribosome-binding factor A
VSLFLWRIAMMRHKTTSGRPHRVAELLRERLALILLHKCADPRLQELTLTQVEMSPDLKQARVYYAARPQADDTQVRQALDKALGFIKQEVARENLFRLMPEIIFLPDRGLDEAERLEQLFREAGMSAKNEEGSDN